MAVPAPSEGPRGGPPLAFSHPPMFLWLQQSDLYFFHPMGFTSCVSKYSFYQGKYVDYNLFMTHYCCFFIHPLE